MDEKDFFVGIYEPIDVRRTVLESSKEIVESLQSSTNLKKIRKEKLLLYEEMRQIMSEIDMLVTRLNKKLPKSHLRKKDIKKEIPPEIKKLEKQLRNIETEFNKI
jgi:hypothetical protein